MDSPDDGSQSRPEPLTHAADESMDLHGITTWEPRSVFDRLLASYTWPLMRAAVVLLALLIFGLVLVLIAVQIVLAPQALWAFALFPLSVVPALLIGGYVWYTDVSREPVLLLLATFLLGVVLAAFPVVTNTLVAILIAPAQEIPVLGFFVEAAYFFFVVAPVEEAVKIGAVFAYVYWKDEFDTVIDGAVYGAMAGLGFATIENFSYIVQVLAQTEGIADLVVGAGVITGLRGIVGPGHVIWTALAGYYLGLAKFNREYALPLAIKGLLIATILHAVYNTTTTGIGRAGEALGLGGLALIATIGFILVYHGTVFAYLFVKLRRYRLAYAEASPGEEAAPIEEIEGYGEARKQARMDETNDKPDPTEDSPHDDPRLGDEDALEDDREFGER